MPSVWAIRITAGIGAIVANIFLERLYGRWIVRLMPKGTRLLLRSTIDIKELRIRPYSSRYCGLFPRFRSSIFRARGSYCFALLAALQDINRTVALQVRFRFRVASRQASMQQLLWAFTRRSPGYSEGVAATQPTQIPPLLQRNHCLDPTLCGVQPSKWRKTML